MLGTKLYEAPLSILAKKLVATKHLEVCPVNFSLFLFVKGVTGGDS